MLNCSDINCVGCSACEAICPKNVITLERNDEGFQYPQILNARNCINCGLCEQVCPVINLKPEIVRNQIGLIAQINNEIIRQESASGGMFSAIALSVLNENGVVYGAAYTENFEVCHIGVSCMEDLWKLRNSKYVQSNLKNVFKEVKHNLDTGRKVCFSGTPCQVEGLQCFLKKEYDNLILVDVVCHGVSSPLVWDKYLETISKYHPKKIYFRWKHYGYKYSTMSFFDDNDNEIYFAGVEADKMLRAYFSNNCDRETCYDCQFKKRYRVSDFTIWDCFQPQIYNKKFNDDRGTSAVLIHSEKGLRQFEKIVGANIINYQYISSDELVFGNREMIGSVKRGQIRDVFLSDAKSMPGEDLFEKHFPNSSKIKIKKFTRLILLHTKIYGLIKYILFVYRRKKYKNN